jgi:RNA polymerase sigma-70 factor, ECF subfamily
MEPDPTLDAAWHEHRPYLLDLAFRMVGSITEAEDLVQDAFTRLLRVDAGDIEDLRGWLIVVVSRLALDHLRSARHRHEARAVALDLELLPAPDAQLADPADRITLDDSVRLALLVVLERLTPAERAAFVLHDVFQFPFETVASIVGRSPAACRQLASRARRRVTDETEPSRFVVGDLAEQRRVAERFIAACATGDVDAIMQVLDADVVGEVDLGDPARSRGRRLAGAARVGRGILSFFGPQSGLTLVSQPVNGEPGVLAFDNGTLRGILVLRASDGLIQHIHAIADPEKLTLVDAALSGR